MNKINNFILIYPMLINFMMMFMMIIPSKINKFHPISLLMILILLTFFICLKMNFFKKSMIPFILFLIMIGGLMVIFMYITSLSNNELFTFNYLYLIMNIMKSILFIMIFFLLLNQFFQLTQINKLIETFSQLNYFQNNQINLNNMYKEFNNKSSYFIMMYLYYSMICIMNICLKFKAPLRQLIF